MSTPEPDQPTHRLAGRQLLLVGAVVAVLSSVATGVAGGILALPVSAASATVAPRAPTTPVSIKATPALGGIKVSWTKVSGAGVTYSVSSTPQGKSCSVVNENSCFISVTDSTPWQFSVTASATAGSSAPSPLTANYPHRVVLLVAGQSNAIGAGSYAVDPVTKINYYGDSYANGADSNDLLQMAPWFKYSNSLLTEQPVPLNTPQQRNGKGALATFGPEIGLARQLWKNRKLPVTIIKCAYGGTTLAVDWNPNLPPGQDPATWLQLYPKTLSTVKNVMTADAKAGQLDTLGGIYWYQGETDVTTEAYAVSYQANLTNLIARFRADLPISASAPFGIVKESKAQRLDRALAMGWCTPEGCAAALRKDARVRAADDWAAANLNQVYTVDSLDAGRLETNNPDDSLIHLTNLGELLVGQRLAQATENFIS